MKIGKQLRTIRDLPPGRRFTAVGLLFLAAVWWLIGGVIHHLFFESLSHGLRDNATTVLDAGVRYGVPVIFAILAMVLLLPWKVVDKTPPAALVPAAPRLVQIQARLAALQQTRDRFISWKRDFEQAVSHVDNPPYGQASLWHNRAKALVLGLNDLLSQAGIDKTVQVPPIDPHLEYRAAPGEERFSSAQERSAHRARWMQLSAVQSQVAEVEGYLSRELARLNSEFIAEGRRGAL